MNLARPSTFGRTLLTNARVVTPLGVVDGSLAIDDGRIAEVVPRSYRDGTDVRGALLMPGVIDAHTDYLEKEISPRPGAEVPLEMAMHAMDLRALELGMLVCMGAPNYVRGGSHCGNLAAADAFAEGLVDMLCSDYHFPSLLACAVLLIASGTPPPAVSALLSLNPARHLGIDAELGSIEPGKRADLVAFHARDGYADVTQTWVDGVSQFAVRDAVGRTAFAL